MTNYESFKSRRCLDQAEERSVSLLIDDIGIGWAQLRLIFLAGPIFFIAGEFYIFALILSSAIVHDLGVDSSRVAELASAQFVGLLLGNLASTFTDRFNRRSVVLWSMFGTAIFIPASSLPATSLHAIAFFWCLTGFCLGICLPTYNALLTEISPTAWRFTMGALSQLQFPLGCLFAVLVLCIASPNWDGLAAHWRTVLRFGQLPSTIILLLGLYSGFVDSPVTAAARGEHAEVRKQLTRICTDNKRPDVDVSAPRVSSKPSAQQSSETVLFSERLAVITIVVAMAFVRLNFTSTGTMHALVRVLSTVEIGLSRVTSLIFAIGFMLAGNFTAVGLGRISRRALMQLATVAEAGFTILFLAGVRVLEMDSVNVRGTWLVSTGINGIHFVSPIAWAAMYCYATEVFPPKVSAAGAGLCMALGRIGSLASPFLFDFLLHRTGSYISFFALSAVLCLTHFCLVQQFLPETRGFTLDELARLDVNRVSKV